VSEGGAQDRPHVLILAGPNGAGKSTAAASMLWSPLGVTEFVNADVIAQGLSAFNPDGAAMQAGRIMLARLKQLADERASFAFETTLASRNFAPWIAGLRQSGYRFHLDFFWLPSDDMAVQRVASRVRTGGHHVPEETVRRRYGRGLSNFFQAYMPLASSWAFYDNSDDRGPRRIASAFEGGAPDVADIATWTDLVRRYGTRA
jgi:predicted ABC-type ATPase